MKIRKMFESLKIGSVEIPNRFIVSPMVMNCCTDDGFATEKFIAYHEEKAKGGWGLIITEDYAVSPEGRGYNKVPGLWKDEQINGHTRLVDRVHMHGAKIFAQIYHCGRQTNSELNGYGRILAPSALPCPALKSIPEELSIAEIREIIEKFGDTAERAKKCGFDGIQIHGGHGYLVAEFMSAYTNKRADEYGGSLLQRLRFPIEIIENIRKKCGSDFPIDFRISGDERMPGGLTIEEVKVIASALEEAGIDSINVSTGCYGSRDCIIPTNMRPKAWISDLSKEVKSVVSIPVTTVGRVNDPYIAESLLMSNKADAVFMGRASLADPHMPEKIRSGRYDDVIFCITCEQGCSDRVDKGMHGTCLLNPRTAREDEYILKQAERKKKILIVGAGPAGMEAAIVAALRGHDVEVYEKKKRAGGNFAVAAMPPWKGEISSFIRWQLRQMEKLGVKLFLNAKADKELILSRKPDAVILATGGTAVIPEIDGIQYGFVSLAADVLSGKKHARGKSAVIGGGSVGAETAFYLAVNEEEPVVIEAKDKIIEDEPEAVRNNMLSAFEQYKIPVIVGAKIKKICRDGSIVLISDEKESVTERFDNVVIAVGYKPFEALRDELHGEVPEIHMIGDCKESGNALKAINEGYLLGLKI